MGSCFLKGDGMTAHPSVRGAWSILTCLLVLSSLATSRAQDELPPEIDSDGVQTLTRGPVHEAFASPTVADPKPGLVVPKPPPADIKEQPPEYQPEGQNVQWFPGYWAWDEDRDDYIWISGAWRDPPPGKRWVPGYWAEVPGGFQWVAGFWIDEQVEEMQYLKPPPESLEQGPSVASPGDDYFYIPGNWSYINNDYQWNAGYWAPYREDWVYVPAHWVWTPGGCVFVNGYWDWRVPRRGQIFAPIFISPVVYQRPTYFYTPRCVINTSNLFVHLWVRDSYCHYYFGNYYGPTYAHRHFTPWCNYTARPRCYDPLFTYCNVHYHRQGINYADRMKGWHNHYVSHTHERPAMTWKDQARILNQNVADRPAIRTPLLAQDLKDVIHKPDQHQQWKRLDRVAKEHNKASIEQVKQLHKMRLDQEKFVSRDLPGRNDNDRDGRPNRGPNLTDTPKVPDLKLPGKPGVDNPTDKPGRNNPADKIADIQKNLPGKFKLPKPVMASADLTPNKPKIEVPAAPEKTVVSRPIGRPDTGDKPFKVLDNKPLTDANKPNPTEKPNRVPGLRNPPANLGPQLDPPGNTTTTKLPDLKPDLKPDVKPLEPKLPGRDLGNTKKPDLGGKPSNTNSAANAAQQRIEALRKQQQDALNRLSTPKNQPDAFRVPENQGGRTSTPKVEVPRVETPKVDRTPKIETPKRDIVRPPLSSGSSNPSRNLGGGNPGGINLGGGNSSKPNVVPRSTIPNVEPRNFNKPNVPVNPSPRSNSIQQLQPRNSAPRVEVPRNNPVVPRNDPNNNGQGNNAGEKKRGR
jgi:hypothetical protein